jgi:O-methyltransferase
MLDSFQGLPPVEKRDGPAAFRYQSETGSPHYYDNCTAPLDEVKITANDFGFSSSEAIIVPGWFNDTIPENIKTMSEKGFSLLRIDCDWYEPVKYVLDNLIPLVSENCAVILDDYYVWDGCARATHDFLSEQDLPYRLKTRPPFDCAWMVKQAFRPF